MSELFATDYAQSFLAARTRVLSREVDSSNRALVVAYARIRATDAELAHVKLALSIAEADTAGRLAQVIAMKSEHPTSNLLKDSGQRFATSEFKGEVKDKLRLIYEKAFDVSAIAASISNPVSRRNN